VEIFACDIITVTRMNRSCLSTCDSGGRPTHRGLNI